VKVLIVEDQALARDSLIGLCECRGDIQVVGEAACGKAAIDAAGTLNPEIVLLDAELPDMSGFDLLRAGNVEYLSRDSIKRLSVQLAEFGFIRIARSLLVNAAAVLYAELAGHGTFALTLASGVCLHSSAAYRDSILRIIPLPGLSKRYGGT
jgi:DNA-binding LytR/AlgR family response regulator